MTRESKLALVIGITLVLLVGVLISDHLSGATGAQFDAPTQPVAAVNQPVVPLSDDLDRLQGRPAPLAVEPAGDPVWRTPEVYPGDAAVLGGDQPIEISQGGSGPGILEHAIDRLKVSDPPALTIHDMFEPVRNRAVTATPDERDAGQPVKPAADHAPPEPQTKTQPQPAEQVRYRTHTVAEGDSLYALARTYLGDGNRWTELQKLNADVLGGGETLKVGVVLRIDRAAAPTKPAPRPSAATDRPLRAYVVLKGDMLGTIAQKLLGTSRRMQEIVELNGLKDPDDIRVGQTLKIPHK